VFIDEIDSTLSLPFTDDFFAAIRYVYNARSQTVAFDRLTFVLIGVASPNDLISDSTRTPFNIGSQVNVDYFTLDEAIPLTEGFDLSPERSRQVLEWIMSWTGGHPYLTQRLCASAASRGKQTLNRSELDGIVRETFFGQQSSEDSNLRFVQDMVVRRAPDTQAALSLYERIARGRKVSDEKASHVIAHLKLSGIVTRDNGSLKISNRIYAEVFDLKWVRSQFPEHWIKRVPLAVKGAVAASFVAVIAVGLFAFQSQRAAQERVRSEILAESNVRLSDEVARTDSARAQLELLNIRLDDQLEVTDSLLLEEERTNVELTDQIRVSNQLRAESYALRLRAEDAALEASEQKAVSDSLRHVAEELLEAARRERIETITIALASHSQRQLRLGDAELGALLARQAYLFSRRGQGQFIAPVHDALRAALDELGRGPAIAGVLNTSAVRSISFAPAGEHLAWGDESGQIKVAATLPSGTRVATLKGHDRGIRAIAFGPNSDRNVIASGGESGRILLWDNPNDSESEAVDIGAHTSSIWALDFSSDGRELAVAGGDRKVTVWDVQSQTLDTTITLDEPARVRALKFIPGERTLVVGTESGNIHFHGSARPDNVRSTGQGRILALAVSPDGTRLATGGATADIKLWRLDQPSAEVVTLQGHEGPINTLAFSPDGQRLASGSADHSIQIWDVNRPTVSPVLLQGHDSWVWSLAFSPDGARIASAGADKRVSTWYVDLEEMADRVCSAVTRDLTTGEWDRFVGADVPFEENVEPCLTSADAAGIPESIDGGLRP
jgi:WD40 repeat protein